MTYKEYAKKQYDESLKKEHFDPKGDSTTAVCNRSFFKQMLYNVEHVNEGFIEVIQSWKTLVYALLGLLTVLAFPVTYPLILIMSTYFSKRRAKKEMTQSYMNSKVDKLHE